MEIRPPESPNVALDAARFERGAGIAPLAGNELLLKGALEAGVGLLTGYPGSPVAEIFDLASEHAALLASRGMLAEIANNEALAAARLTGARQAGARALCAMKSVGFHVAADALATGNLIEVRQPAGGAVALVGDDPWNESTQVNADSRFLSRHLHMPVLEPSTYQEMKDWLDVAFDLSGRSDFFITYLVTAALAEGGGSVTLRPNKTPPAAADGKTPFDSRLVNPVDTVLLPPHLARRLASLPDRQDRLFRRARELAVDRLRSPAHPSRIGFVSSGVAAAALDSVLRRLGIRDAVWFLKLGLVYPLDPEKVLAMASEVDHLFVVEERRSFIEGQICEMVLQAHQRGRLTKMPAIWGKHMPGERAGFPSEGGLNVSIVTHVLAPILSSLAAGLPGFNANAVAEEEATFAASASIRLQTLVRTPTFCPGCPHRDSAVVAGEAVKNAPRGGEIVVHGDCGCHSMLGFAPYESLMHNYAAMGLGGGAGSGMSPFVDNRHVVFLGDSTFFHSGLLAISDSIRNGRNITYVILDNKTTAMTGHQPTPASERNLMGQAAPVQDIGRIVSAMLPADAPVITVSPADRERYGRIFEETIRRPGVKVILADKECAITFHRRESERRRLDAQTGFVGRETRISIATEVCDYCLDCTRQTACPGLSVVETVHGPKIATSLSSCVDDGACSRAGSCPAFEKIEIVRSGPPVLRSPVKVASPPEPPRVALKRPWYVHTAGVGGMGIATINGILALAGIREGFHVSFMNKNGLAIRSGGVFGQVVISPETVETPSIPYGRADVVLGLDLVETARCVDGNYGFRVSSPGRTFAVVDTERHDTVLSLIGRETMELPTLRKSVAAVVRPESVFLDFSDAAESAFGSRLHANMLVLGVAFQKGQIPCGGDSIRFAISEVFGPEKAPVNLAAFELGRCLADGSTRPAAEPAVKTVADAINEAGQLLDSDGASPADIEAFRALSATISGLPCDESVRITAVRAVADLIRGTDRASAQRYVSRLESVVAKDRADRGWSASRAVAMSLFHVYAIKDELWVARMLTSADKAARDRARYRLQPGDRISYRHLLRPRFRVLGKTIDFGLEARPWMLKALKGVPFIRSLTAGGHRSEADFRDWFDGLVTRFGDSSCDYRTWVEILEAPLQARGFRGLREPAIAAVREKVAALMGGQGSRSGAPTAA